MKESQTKQRYFEAVGRRKTSTARVRLYPTESPKGLLTINGKELKDYFPTTELKNIVKMSAESSASEQKFDITAIVKGGGIHSQAEALKHGIARALVLFEPQIRKTLKKFKLLKRDPRAKERRKFGLKKARKAPQWSKR